ncbi:DUF397 domain-containing protein [Saccharothrix sp. HUAS TT1]|uniref:DUF397 domain-containing protein n=1 Tax=unclassified Saccharothrix TaxID=2593673 RepID=UPI00345C349F
MTGTAVVRSRWFKSSYSGAADDNCVEVRFADDVVGVRDSKNPRTALTTTPSSWRTFIGMINRSIV